MSNENTAEQSYDGPALPSTGGLRIAVVGLGRAGLALASELHAAGCQLVALWNRSERPIPECLTGIPTQFGGESPAASLIETANLVLLAVHDSAIRALAASLQPAEGAVLLHLSGALSTSAFGPLRADLHAGCYHPLQSFRTTRSPGFAVPPYCLALEGDEQAIQAGRHLAETTGHPWVILPPEGKAAYHAAAVMTSGCMVALHSAASAALKQAGIAEDDCWPLLWPLAVGTLANLADGDFAGSLTGPVARGDAETVRRNLEALSGQPQLAELYRALGLQGLELASQAGLEESRRKATARALTEDEE
ncbi:MAG: Rossmann-like and DUF2520 domain-containing protein [Myxococcota bacterium]|nr:Rossmann-like and DUF2520 domain-containing protein [Myxococcota bacterium]